jgi:hypothetical protein
MCLKHL